MAVPCKLAQRTDRLIKHIHSRIRTKQIQSQAGIAHVDEPQRESVKIELTGSAKWQFHASLCREREREGRRI